MDPLKDTEVCIVGGGPAGLALALCLGRLGRDVLVLEAATQYERSFRGESIQPDTVSILSELGIAESLGRSGWTETHGLHVSERGRDLLRIDFSSRPYRHRYMVDVPQDVLLDTLADAISKLSNVRLTRGARATALIEGPDGEIAGVCYNSGGVALRVGARVVVGADGRYSRIRALAGIRADRVAQPRDFLWCKMPRPDGWIENWTRVLLNGARHLVLLPTHPNLLRTGINIPKGGLAAVKADGLEALHRSVDNLDAAFGLHFREHLRDWSDFNFLEIFTSVAETWGRRGLVLIGDAAHTVTPLLGQGVNIAVEDSVVLAPMLSDRLRHGQRVDESLVAAFQSNREPKVQKILKMQMMQERLLNARSPLTLLARRAYYLALNNIGPLQRRLFDSITYRRQRELGLYV